MKNSHNEHTITLEPNLKFTLNWKKINFQQVESLYQYLKGESDSFSCDERTFYLLQRRAFVKGSLESPAMAWKLRDFKNLADTYSDIDFEMSIHLGTLSCRARLSSGYSFLFNTKAVFRQKIDKMYESLIKISPELFSVFSDRQRQEVTQKIMEWHIHLDQMAFSPPA